MTSDFSIYLAFSTGVLGALHCLGMCSGIAGGFFVSYGRRVAPVVQFHAGRILSYGLLGMIGASLGRVLVQSGIVGKGQGLLMMIAGLVITAIGLKLFGLLPDRGRGRSERCDASSPGLPVDGTYAIRQTAPRPWIALLAGSLNGLVPCSLVFSVAIKAAATADPWEAGLLMVAFGLGTVPTMGLVSLTGLAIGRGARGLYARLSGVLVVVLGIWTLYEGWVFFDVMRGLSNW